MWGKKYSIQIEKCFPFKLFKWFHWYTSTICNFAWNTFDIQFNSLLIIIPRNLAYLLDTGSLYMNGGAIRPFTFGTKYILLSILRDSLLAFNHHTSLLNPLLTTLVTSCKVFERWNYVPSAKEMENRMLVIADMPYLYNQNNNEPGIDLCVTLRAISVMSEEVLSQLTYSYLFENIKPLKNIASNYIVT